MSTQWVWAGLGERVGLNYQSLDFFLKMYPKARRRAIFRDVQIMEMAALQCIREAKGK